MQVKINIRMPQIAQSVKAQVSAAIPTALNALASFTRDRLTSAAQRSLKGQALSEYLRGLQATDSIEIKETSAVIRLVGDFPQAIEMGSSPFSIKNAMLAKATKRTKDGRPYVDVPFRHGTQENAANLQGMPADVASTMKQSVEQAQKAMRSSGMSVKESKLAKVRVGIKTPGQVSIKNLSTGGTLTTTHKAGIYNDMLRVPKLYKKAIQSTYITMRRISDKSNPTSWEHPGLKPANIFDGVKDEIQRMAPKIVSDILQKAGM